MSPLDGFRTTDQATSPSSQTSSTPVAVTVCAVFHAVAAKVSDDGDTVPSVASPDPTATVTACDGCVSSATVKVAVPPPSVA